MNIPTKIRILGQQWSVLWQPHLAGSDGKALLGLMDDETNTITLRSNLRPNQMASTFLHEIIEALVASCDLKINHSTIATLESGLYQVLKDNKLDFSQ